MAKVSELRVNGVGVAVDVEVNTSLLTVLRERLHLTGSKIGCGEGECGACTVLVDGVPVHSCVTPVSSVVDKSVVTIEGIGSDGTLHPLQQAFLDVGAFQCGYCTPGMIVAGVALLNRLPDPSEAEIVAALQGNVCRCGTYRRIVRAIQQAAVAMQDRTATGEVR